MNPEDIEVVKANVAKLVAKGAPEQDIHDYLEASGYPQVTPHAQPKIGQMGHPIVDADEGQPVNDDREVLGGIASLAHDIPFAESLQAMGGMKPLNLMKAEDRAQFIPAYKESLANLRGAENSANPWLRRFNNLAGGTIAAAATPGKTVMGQGAKFGVAEAIGNAEPQTVKDRIDAIPGRVAVDALAGKVFGELAPNIARTAFAKSLGKNVLDRTGAMEGADAVNFGKAKAEGDLAAANPTPQVVSDALNETDVKPYVAIVRGSGLFKGADDPTVLREAYKLMGERERNLGSRIVGSDDYKAGSELERNEIIQGKRTLSDASKQIMPSFPGANLTHAKAEGELDALKAGADATGRIVKGTNVAGKKLATNSPEAFLKSILEMRDGKAKATQEGVMGKLKETNGLTLNPLKLFGAPQSIARVNRMAPYISALDEQSGNSLPLWLRAAGISAGSNVTH